MFAVRLREGDDLKESICNFVASHKLTSATIVSSVGSLSSATLRMAGASPGAQDVRKFTGPFEIVSLTGTIALNGKSHLHISLSDRNGTVIGGHVKEGCSVHTTAELVIISDENIVFSRQVDASTGFEELFIEGKK